MNPPSELETSTPFYHRWKDSAGKKKINKDLVELNSTINQLDIINIYWLLHPTTAEYTFFSSSHETITKRDHILSHKTYINKFKRIKII